MKTKQQFLIDSLKPYLLDRNLCGIGADGTCRYQTIEGKKCAIGQYIRPELYNREIEATYLSDLLEMDIFTPEFTEQHLTRNEAEKMQRVHDAWAGKSPLGNIIDNITQLENEAEVDLTELKELIN